jgi:hypothetical protein
MIIIIYNNIFTAIGLLPGGSGYITFKKFSTNVLQYTIYS